MANIIEWLFGGSRSADGNSPPAPVNTPAHPFYPQDLKFPNYVPSSYSAFETFSIFFGALSVIVFPSLYLILNRTSVAPRNKAIFIWFAVCACIHLVLEGYFAYFHATMAEDDTILGQLWKEYSLSDSRYLTSDPLVVCMERVTAVSIEIEAGSVFIYLKVKTFILIFGGPLSIFTCLAIYFNWPSRHVLQLTTSIIHLYGDVLYYWTTIFQGSPHSRPEAYYYWFYFIFINSIWVIIPTLLTIESWKELTKVVSEDYRRKSKKLQ
ncbi:9459_t:CDS:2 [Paraglomus brasilianum]|uniref:9459_t:CDS:1 n=1 Tax=Paraglomus brasilianum TaxID=144538 RepID=A0A9N9BD79_9GLOM|nr:9459_t:CDS:2 [Paraglomus brasilianum]